MRQRGLVALAPLAMALAACSGTPSPSSGSIPSSAGTAHYKVGNPYRIGSIWYYPKEDTGYDHTGIASWYGPQFHGKRTANGEIFDENKLTAAHPTLPLPVLVRVTNLENGKSLIVRVNDRGPFAAGREIDLSKEAAKELGYMRQGTTKVRVQYIARAALPGDPGYSLLQAAADDPSRETFVAAKPKTAPEERKVAATAPVQRVSVVSAGLGSTLTAPDISTMSANKPAASMQPIPDGQAQMAPIADDKTVNTVSRTAADPVAAPTGKLYVQAGSFQDLANAEKLQQQLSGMGKVSIQQTYVDGAPYYRVRVGPVSDLPSADSTLQQIIGDGHPGARIVTD
ncbi:rare lipoprotein A [Parvibaculum indicum]|uniref:septal ring lytic transglycosylase RlpA family protein n=1 Tax=Parvibaculum indicum TaxID=562969 RepID=UPI0019662459|nr:septal ring lytic transglycosylase RlpA family protein [Parvibaculum indicum]NIJ39753.1 rare lipoprotein A [Parvibaculum indicum]